MTKQRWVRLDDILASERLRGESFSSWFARAYGVPPELVVRMYYDPENIADMVEYREPKAEEQAQQRP